MPISRFFVSPAFTLHKTQDILNNLKNINGKIESLSTELCYHVELLNSTLNSEEEKKIKWMLSFPLKCDDLKERSNFSNIRANQIVIECGPRFNFSTADSSNAVQMCQIIGLNQVTRLEVSKRYLITFSPEIDINFDTVESISKILYDRMTQCIYTEKNMPVNSFNENLPKSLEEWFIVPVLEKGKSALKEVNDKLGLAFDDWDINFYTDLFHMKLKRNPTSVECFDLAQSNSEHSRHWFFKGKIIIDGVEYDKSLIEMIANTQDYSNKNNVIKFSDNSSAIKGFLHKKLAPENVNGPCRIATKDVTSDIIFTAETHNMPTAVAPFSGATTGTGGRIRDVQAVGRGGHTVAGTAGYCVGCLHIPDFETPWEDDDLKYPYNFASPLEILIEASNGASDYGNKFGEPIISGFAISYGLLKPDGVRDEYVKPVMFTGGIGYMPNDMINKTAPENGMLVVKLGGPVYRIGVGGGAASSVAIQGDESRSAALDFGAVQRGDPEMGNRLNRVVRACLESCENPIQAIHDQGAGGNGNVIKELVEPNGAIIFTKEFTLGDPTITTMELWGAEYQESNAIICYKNDKKILEDICSRERCPVCFVGEVTKNGRVTLVENSITNIDKYKDANVQCPFDLNLDVILGKIPRKVFNLTINRNENPQLSLPSNLSILEILRNVFKLVSVGSKRYLTNKVDRCVSGLVAQQQCVGPLHTPLSDFGIIALSYFDTVGSATSIGTQPLKGLVNPEAGARMSVGEALTNLVFAGITDLSDVKCSGNWMWSGKTGDEGGKLAIACSAMCDMMMKLGIAIDGGKDSLSMSARVDGKIVQSPGTLVISTYAPCPNIMKKVEPYFKTKGSVIFWIPITPNKYRLGGTALAQCFKQQGNDCPDVDDPNKLKNIFNIIQKLVEGEKILSGHDISDGGLITTVLEMAFAGLCGVTLNFNNKNATCIETLFSEELGLVIEVSPNNTAFCKQLFKENGIISHEIGVTEEISIEAPVRVNFNGDLILSSTVLELFKMWEEISYKLELLQANSECVREEWEGLKYRTGPKYHITFDPEQILLKTSTTVKVAVIREEGINGDREMIASLVNAHFEVYDVTMHDLSSGAITLDKFQGIVFPGGFSYADTLGSAKGWAASILFNDNLRLQFNNFAFTRKNTFSSGVCNGCQLMALIGWIGTKSITDNRTPEVVLDHNKSERFECRWSSVKINHGKGENVWFKNMADSILGVWIAHGEGRFTFQNNEILDCLKDNNQICMQYVDDNGKSTQIYPMNPNGSPYGIASICSPDGRHLALMPHPERCTLNWQCAYPITTGKNMFSPWQKMFNNAYEWSINN